MSTVRAIERRRVSFVARLAEAAGEQSTRSFSERLRARMGGRRDARQQLVELIEEMVAADEAFANVAPSVGSLLRSSLAAEDVTSTFAGEAAVATDPEDVLTPDDVLRIARVRGQAEAAVLSEPMYEASTVARVLGSTSKNPREYARSLRTRAGVLALRNGNRYLFPAFQFNEARREVRPVVAEINQMMDAATHPWAAASFWCSPDPYLQARPADLVADPGRGDDIRRAAQRAVAPIG